MYLLYNGNEDDKRAVVAAGGELEFLRKVGEYVLKKDEFYLFVDQIEQDKKGNLTIVNDVDLFKGNDK